MPLGLDKVCGKIIQSCPKARLFALSECLALNHSGKGGGYYQPGSINNVKISPVHSKRTKAELLPIDSSLKMPCKGGHVSHFPG